jgi:Flp pilus assembly protein TadB
VAGAALRVASLSGGRAGDVFLRLADRAAANAELARQRKVLTAQARASALTVGSLPLFWFLFGGWSQLQTLVANGGASIAAVGVGMETLGALLVWRLAAS